MNCPSLCQASTDNCVWPEGCLKVLVEKGVHWYIDRVCSRVVENRGGLAGQVGGHYVELFRLDDPIGGEHMNIFKAGLITAHRIVAVSHGWVQVKGLGFRFCGCPLRRSKLAFTKIFKAELIHRPPHQRRVAQAG